MCPIFQKGTGSIFPPDSLLNKLIEGNLIKGIGKCVCGFLYGFLMVVRERAKLQTQMLPEAVKQPKAEVFCIMSYSLSVLSLVSVSRKQQPDCLMQATKSGITLPKIGFLVTGGRFRSKVLELWFTDGWQSTKHQSVHGNCSALNQKPSYRQLCTN